MTEPYWNEGLKVRRAPECYLCGEAGRALYAGLRDRLFSAPGVWSLLECPACGLVWLDPRPEPEDIPKLYSRYYTHEGMAPGGGWLAALKGVIKRAVLAQAFGYGSSEIGTTERLVGSILSRVHPIRDVVGADVLWLPRPAGGTLLDVGCGNGEFLVRMRQFGWQVMGVEPDLVAAEQARRSGLKVVPGSLEDAAFAPESCDVITMHHVIEHLWNPVSTLRECRRLLKPGGRLVIVTPNIASLGHRRFHRAWRGLEPPRHLFLFSPVTLGKFLERVGFQPEKLRTSARGARFMWAVSNSLSRRSSRADVGQSEGRDWVRLQARVSWLHAVVFWLIEELLTRRPVGEELIAVSRKA